MKKLRKVIKKLGIIVLVLVVVLTLLLTFSIHWMLKTWANLSMEELVYHLQVPLEGTNESMVTEYIKVALLPTILIGLLIIVGMTLTRKRKKTFRVLLFGSLVLSICVGGFSVYQAWEKLDISEYIANKMEDSVFIDTLYADPGTTKITFPAKKRNLIYIFLESMETTYADKKKWRGL